MKFRQFLAINSSQIGKLEVIFNRQYCMRETTIEAEQERRILLEDIRVRVRMHLGLKIDLNASILTSVPYGNCKVWKSGIAASY